MTLLVTGHRGFVGGHLAAAAETMGLNDARGELVDLLDLKAVTDAVMRLRPSSVLHMAAQSAVPESFRDPVTTYQVNFLGTQNLLAALKAVDFIGRFLYISSAEVYGAADADALPMNESGELEPLNPYAVSKLAAEMLCSYHQRVEGMQVIIARPFNHIGPGQSTRFAIADFARAIVEMRLGRRSPVLQVGDLDVTRDFTDVRDVVRAYLLLLDKGRPGETYNVCSGQERNMRDAVDTLASLAGIPLSVEIDPARFRKASQQRSCGDSTKLRAHTGWAPEISWQTSLKDILTTWETQLA